MEASEVREVIIDFVEQAVASVAMLRNVFKREVIGAWADPRIGMRGSFPLEGIEYRFHGKGCAITTADGEVDLDFDENGRCDGFDAWRLRKFLLGRQHGARDVPLDELERALSDLAKLGCLESHGGHWYLREGTHSIS